MNTWHKSSYSPNSGSCVEVRERPADDAVDVRDTQNRELGHIVIPAREWAALLADVRRDRL